MTDLTLILMGLIAMSNSSSPTTDSLANGFRNVPNDAKMRMYWRVFGPAWTRDEIDTQLDIVKKADIGGLTVYFMYPYALDDPANGIVNQQFGSEEFLKTWTYAATKAKEKELRFALNGSTGWPYGGPTVKGKDAAQRLYQRVVKARSDLKLKDGEKVLAAFQDGKDVTKIFHANKISSNKDIKIYITGPTGMWVKRAANGAAGPVLSHYDKPALGRYLKQVIEPIVDRSKGLMQGLGCDSLEVYNSNWTDDLPREFKKRRGYDLLPVLPDLFAKTSTVRFDFWRTLAELTEERFTKPLGDWSKKHGLDLEMEAYGTPPNPMTSYRFIQIPTGEHYEWKGFSIQKYVASAANQCKRNIIGSEAWTWAGIPNRLIDSLSDIKLVSDMTFVAGANDITGVDYAYSPRAAGSPGWMPYYGPVFNQNNPQWAFFPTLTGYLNRCQWLLRQGKPVRNVALYIPVEDSFTQGTTEMMLLDFEVRDRLVTGKATSEFGLKNALKHQSDVVHGLISRGYDYDGIDFWSMNRLARISGKKLSVGDARYSAIVLPNLETIETEAARKIVAFCESGGVVVATRRLPTKAAGKLGYSVEIRSLMTRLFGSRREAGKVRKVGAGHTIYVDNDADAGVALSPFVKSDVVYTPAQTTVGYVHRKTAQGDVYFFSNVGPDEVTFTPSFPKTPRRIELWDALTGSIQVVCQQPLKLNLPARGSIFVVLNHETADSLPYAAIGTEETQELSLHWKIDFEGPDAPASTETDKLVSWTQLPGGKAFSGLGHYHSILQWNGSNTKRILLRFEDIREAAEIKVNGKSAGVLITNPWEVDITLLLQKGDNRIDVTVANLLVNRVIGMPDPDLKELRAKYGSQFQAPEEKLLMSEPAPSGIIGTVWLVIEK